MRFNLFALLVLVLVLSGCGLVGCPEGYHPTTSSEREKQGSEGATACTVDEADVAGGDVNNEVKDETGVPSECAAYEIKDCNGNCANSYHLDNGWCNEEFRCEEFNWDEGDCCPEGQIRDCDQNCAFERFLGDGTCDYDYWNEHPDVFNFRCKQFNWDEGDCCPLDEIKDCNGECWPQKWLEDDVCDDGNHPHVANFNCKEFHYDQRACVFCGDGVCAGWELGESTLTCLQDCPAVCGDHYCDWIEHGKGTPESCPDDCSPFWDECNDGEILDCHGHCQLAMHLGNGVCDTGKIELRCWWLDYDGGDCDSCGDGFCYGGEDCMSCPQDCPVCPPPKSDTNPCDDGDACTVDSQAYDGSCLNVEIDFGPSYYCTVKDSQPTAKWVPIQCDDGDACTDDHYNRHTKLCWWQTKQCQNPLSERCEVSDQGTAQCVTFCDDYNACTIDSYDSSTGLCTHTVPQPPGGNKCFFNMCDDPETGALHLWEKGCNGTWICNPDTGECEDPPN